jgi:hypothetical protein
MIGGLLFSKPTGRYYLKCVPGAVSVYEDIKFGLDRQMFVGQPGHAYQLYMQLSKPPVVIQKSDGVEATW